MKWSVTVVKCQTLRKYTQAFLLRSHKSVIYISVRDKFQNFKSPFLTGEILNFITKLCKAKTPIKFYKTQNLPLSFIKYYCLSILTSASNCGRYYLPRSSNFQFIPETPTPFFLTLGFSKGPYLDL